MIISPLNPLTSKPARLSILLCLTPDDFTRQWRTPGSQWVKIKTLSDDCKTIFTNHNTVPKIGQITIVIINVSFILFIACLTCLFSIAHIWIESKKHNTHLSIRFVWTHQLSSLSTFAENNLRVPQPRNIERFTTD